MNAKRKNAQEFILKYIKKIAPGKFNHGLYEDLFKGMSDKDFDKFMLKLKNKEISLSIIAPVDKSVNISMENNIAVAKELGYDFFQHLTFSATGSKSDGTYIPEFTTPVKYMILDLPFRRTAQLLTKGISVATDSNSIDLTTGQVTGDSRSAKLTKPELEILVGMGLEHSVIEMMKTRGGDLGAARAMEASIAKTGKVSQEVISNYATGVVSSKTVKAFFNAAHLKVDGIV